jgi:hypothetical protein
LKFIVQCNVNQDLELTTDSELESQTHKSEILTNTLNYSADKSANTNTSDSITYTTVKDGSDINYSESRAEGRLSNIR